jgi:uncharacterized protein (TIGR02147 family)
MQTLENIDIYLFDSYKAYLDRHEAARPRGFRALIAKAIKCRSAYVSQVLSGSAHFSLEQAERISEMLGQDEKETEFFLLLVLHERAATPTLKKRLARQIRRTQDGRLQLKNRLDIPSLDLESQMHYYSSWKYGAVHAAVSIPDLNSPEKIAKYLGISVQQVSSILNFLLKAEILSNDGGRIVIGKRRLHLADDAPSIVQHHSQWRLKAIEALNYAASDDHGKMLHYSSVVSLSTADAKAIRELLQRYIQSIKAKIATSPEEQVYGFNLDFYPVAAFRAHGTSKN